VSELLDPILEKLDTLGSALKIAISTAAPLNVSSGNWSFPGITRGELIERVTYLRELVANAHQPTA